jgi:predicted MFS family arabinose efflux permease
MEKKKLLNQKQLSFVALMLGGGAIYKLYFIDSVFYIQMQKFMGLSHTQIGLLYSIAGIVTTIGFLTAIFITDRFSKKKMIPLALIVNGLAGLGMATFPSFPTLLILYCCFAICSDMLFWPTMLKTIRLMGSETDQGRMFGFLESGRGLIDTIIAFAGLGLFTMLGSGALGFKGAIVFFAGLAIALGIFSYFAIEDDEISKVAKSSERNKIAFEGMMKAFKNIGIWIVAFNIFSVYTVYIGIRYFVPFLEDIYSIPIALASAYGIINGYVLKMVGGPIGGYIADKVTKSAAKFIRIMLIITFIFLSINILLPHGKISVYIAFVISISIASSIFCMRAVYFASMEEVKVPREITGSAMALGSFIGYLPGAFMATIYGTILDSNPGLTGYKLVFTTMAVLCLLGVFVSSILVKRIKKVNELGNA